MRPCLCTKWNDLSHLFSSLRLCVCVCGQERKYVYVKARRAEFDVGERELYNTC